MRRCRENPRLPRGTARRPLVYRLPSRLARPAWTFALPWLGPICPPFASDRSPIVAAQHRFRLVCAKPWPVQRGSQTRPGPYLKQLCRHFGHRNEVSFDDRSGEIRLPSGVCSLDASAPSQLALIAAAADQESLETLQRVIGGDLERVGR